MTLIELGKVACATLIIAMWLNLAFAQTKPEACVDAKLKEHVQRLILDAVDSAFMAHIMSLYQIWLKDYDIESYRAGKGMVRGIYAYQRARDNALRWDPPICKEK